MALGDIPFTVSKQLSESVVAHFQELRNSTYERYDFRSYMERMDIAYQRELDLTDDTVKAKLAAAGGDVTKIQNMQIPIVKPQVESAVTYLTSVFLTGYPIFGVVSGPDNADIATQYNTIMTENSIRGGWVRHLHMFFRDGLKYNIHGVKVSWDKEKIYSPVASATSPNAEIEELIWEGNTVQRLDMYNTFFDTRCAPAEVHKKGDFAGYNEVMTRVQLKEFVAGLEYKSNIADAFGSSFADELYYIPQVNTSAPTNTSNSQFNWDTWLSGGRDNKRGVNYSGAYVITHLYLRIVPADFNMSVPARGKVQIWYFILVNGKHVIFAERQTNLHKFFPILIGQPTEDGLGLQTKSFTEDVIPYQQLASGLWNSRLAAARRRTSDRMLYNPKFIKKSDINSPEPTAKIPVSLPSYNSDIRAAVYQIPFEDSASATFAQEVNAVMEFSFFASGQNKVQQGQFQKGNKTQREFDTVMGNANGRNQAMAIYLESQIFTPLKEMLKLNIIQYQQNKEIYNAVEDKSVKIDAATIRQKAVGFKMSDGLLPADKLISAEEFNVALQTVAAVPAIQQGYNMVPMFSYLMKMRGAEGLDKFEKSPAQMQYEQQLASWQQVAVEAIKAGQQPPPQPQPSQQLQAEQAAKAPKQPGALPAGTNGATETGV